MRKCRGSEHPIVLKLAVVILSSEKRLQELQTEAEEARRIFDQEQIEYRRLRGIWKEELGYLISGRLTANHDTSDLVNEGRQEDTPGFLSFGYFACSLGIART